MKYLLALRLAPEELLVRLKARPGSSAGDASGAPQNLRNSN